MHTSNGSSHLLVVDFNVNSRSCCRNVGGSRNIGLKCSIVCGHGSGQLCKNINKVTVDMTTDRLAKNYFVFWDP